MVSRAIKIKMFFNSPEEYEFLLSIFKNYYIVKNPSRPLHNDRAEYHYFSIFDLEVKV